ncbi:hypothetical protein BJX61DRAFT_547179 [Aspergillus egyptiacus]|nr:hypothetical protein BJX61DRAFT_547179 [Aspergillus egyptiacus]
MFPIKDIFIAFLATTPTLASPYEDLGSSASHLRARDLATSSCVDFGTGAPNGYVSLGQICVEINPETITVTYPTLSNGNSYEEANLYMGPVPPTNRAPGQFPYNGYCQTSGATASCTLPLSAFGSMSCSQSIYIATHAAVSGPASGTGWGQGTVFDCKNPRGNCAKYWTVVTVCQCPVVTTYPPVTCISTITTTTEIVTTLPPSTSSTTCDVPTATTLTVEGPAGSCPPCTAPYFCGC